MGNNVLNRMGLLCVMSCFLCLSACQSLREPGSSSLAHVRITGADSERVLDKAAQVFTEAGFVQTRRYPGERTFERPGSRMDNIKYGTWESRSVIMRARVKTRQMGDGLLLVQCDVDVVAIPDNGNPHRQDENPVLGGYRSEYQKLLDSVQSDLQKK